ncbi:MAG: OmpA family protein [Burkholderiales bacterium]|nr:OmpA family protein [Burkholderiales bacterium]
MQKMTRTLIAAALATVAISALADKDGYASDNRTAVVKSGFNLCWHTSSFSADKAIAECDPDLVPKKAEAAPVAPAAPVVEAPKAAPAAPKKTETLTLNASSLFDFDKATLKDEGKDALSSVAKVLLERKYDPAKTKLEIDGHTDRLGKEAHNQKLSQERADATRDFLIEKGIPASMVTAVGKGSAEPITKPEDCKKVLKNRKKLIACYAPDRRVEVQIFATVEQ